MRPFLFLAGFCAALFFSGCQNNQNSYYPNEFSHNCRPIVAVVPAKDLSHCPSAWPKEQELTNCLVNDIMYSGYLYLTPHAQFSSAVDQTHHMDYFGNDLSFTNFFCQNDFLVITEIIDNKTVPYTKEHSQHLSSKKVYGIPQVFIASARVRVIDLRMECPQIVLQEFVTKEMLISGPECDIDYTLVTPKHPFWDQTPCCRIYGELSQEIARKVESAILCHW